MCVCGGGGGVTGFTLAGFQGLRRGAWWWNGRWRDERRIGRRLHPSQASTWWRAPQARATPSGKAPRVRGQGSPCACAAACAAACPPDALDEICDAAVARAGRDVVQVVQQVLLLPLKQRAARGVDVLADGRAGVEAAGAGAGRGGAGRRRTLARRPAAWPGLGRSAGKRRQARKCNSAALAPPSRSIPPASTLRLPRPPPPLAV